MRSKELRKTLSESHFNPNKPGLFQIIIGIGNPAYWETRAIELVREAQVNETPGSKQYHELLRDAISLLALARTYHAEKHPIQNETGNDNSEEVDRVPKD